MSSNRSHRIALFSTGVALGLSIFSGVASAEPAPSRDPSGNNGTIKVDGIDYDDTPANEPHVGCSFQIDFFGFDLGDRADVRFFAQPPTGDGQQLHEDIDVLVSDDGAAGGPNDIDEKLTYDVSGWDLSALTPSPQQGYHVKVTADVIGAPGGAKQKVFWIDCPPVVPVVVEPVVPVVTVVPALTVVPVVPDVPVVVEPVQPVVPVAPVQPVVPVVPVRPDVAVQPVVSVVPVQPIVPVQPVVVVRSVITTAVHPMVAAESATAHISGVESQRPTTNLDADAQVLGVTFSRGDTLPRTGVDSPLLALVGISVLAVGTVLTRLGRAPSPT